VWRETTMSDCDFCHPENYCTFEEDCKFRNEKRECTAKPEDLIEICEECWKPTSQCECGTYMNFGSGEA